jgi:hypothetical protein
MRIPEIFLGALMAVFLFAMGMIFDLSRHQPSNAKETYEGTAKRNDGEGLLHWLMSDAAGFFTMWLVIVGAGQL